MRVTSVRHGLDGGGSRGIAGPLKKGPQYDMGRTEPGPSDSSTGHIGRVRPRSAWWIRAAPRRGPHSSNMIFPALRPGPPAALAADVGGPLVVGGVTPPGLVQGPPPGTFTASACHTCPSPPSPPPPPCITGEGGEGATTGRFIVILYYVQGSRRAAPGAGPASGPT